MPAARALHAAAGGWLSARLDCSAIFPSKPNAARRTIPDGARRARKSARANIGPCAGATAKPTATIATAAALASPSCAMASARCLRCSLPFVILEAARPFSRCFGDPTSKVPEAPKILCDRGCALDPRPTRAECSARLAEDDDRGLARLTRHGTQGKFVTPQGSGAPARPRHTVR